MFTGIVVGLGQVYARDKQGSETRLTIRPGFVWDAYVHGESIAVNGVCLTVETFGPDWFTAYASAETMQVTNLGALNLGSQVNLERALAMGDRLGGHLVSGHVDCLAQVVAINQAGQSKVFRLQFPQDFALQVIPKGSVALDGISLTINDCGPDYLEVNIIPATQKQTTIATWVVGTMVNMETDMIGKYVSRLLEPWAASSGHSSGQHSAITPEFLKKYGF